MPKQRLEAFSDGVLAIIITIMVLEFTVPTKPTFAALFSHWQLFVSYVLSFIYIGIYWSNHTYLVSAAKRITPKYLWFNLLLLFCLSLLPIGTAWVGQDFYSIAPAVTYGVILTACGLAYQVLQRETLIQHPIHSHLRKELGNNVKGRTSLILYFIGTASAFFWPLVSYLFYVLVAIFYFIPDRRIPKAVVEMKDTDNKDKN